MSLRYSSEYLNKQSVLTLYRLLMKNMRFYPSKKRFELILSIKEEFRQNRTLTDERKIFFERKKAKMGVAHILLFSEKLGELKDNYSISESGFTESLNPRDKDFIYF